MNIESLILESKVIRTENREVPLSGDLRYAVVALNQGPEKVWVLSVYESVAKLIAEQLNANYKSTGNTTDWFEVRRVVDGEPL